MPLVKKELEGVLDEKSGRQGERAVGRLEESESLKGEKRAFKNGGRPEGPQENGNAQTTSRRPKKMDVIIRDEIKIEKEINEKESNSCQCTAEERKKVEKKGSFRRFSVKKS